MRTITSVDAMKRWARRWQRAGVRVGFVPTMGYLHAGHLSLVRRARRAVGERGRVVASIYVNPTQFGPNEDFSKYPRNLVRDKALCREAGVDVLFLPPDDEMYPAAPDPAFSTFVVENELSKPMEGAARPTHFRGVTTVVAKLFNIISPAVAVFGEKDYQQAAVIQRMIRDLNFPVKLIVAPIEREVDGLALSSRNKYLSREERQQAIVLWKAIQTAREVVVTSGKALPASRLKARLIELITSQPAARVDYIEFFDPTTLRASSFVQRGTHLALAVFIGRTRLIDNGRL